jgi:carboxymethylenebutenolidase
VAKHITAPFLGLSGEGDQNPSPPEVPRFIELLQPRNPTAEAVVYPGAGHGFFADYRPSYNTAAAADGWTRCLAHVDTHLRA